MSKYLFTRLITKREAINRYGKLGFTTHKEGVIIEANSLDEAKEKLKPFNYKKHIKFIYSNEPVVVKDTAGVILDFGRVD